MLDASTFAVAAAAATQLTVTHNAEAIVSRLLIAKKPCETELTLHSHKITVPVH